MASITELYSVMGCVLKWLTVCLLKNREIYRLRVFGSTTRLSTAVEQLWLARTHSGTTIKTESNVKNVRDVATALMAKD